MSIFCTTKLVVLFTLPHFIILENKKFFVLLVLRVGLKNNRPAGQFTDRQSYGLTFIHIYISLLYMNVGMSLCGVSVAIDLLVKYLFQKTS